MLQDPGHTLFFLLRTVCQVNLLDSVELVDSLSASLFQSGCFLFLSEVLFISLLELSVRFLRLQSGERHKIMIVELAPHPDLLLFLWFSLSVNGLQLDDWSKRFDG